MLDFWLAAGHHLLMFGLFGILVAELVAVRPGMSKNSVRSIAAIDLWYGVLAGLLLIVGFSRAIFAAKGWDYYEHNAFFWAKIGTFVLIGVLSLPPTLAYLTWRRAAIAPSEGQVWAAKKYLWIEFALFGLLPIFAAAMARGYGE